MANPNIVPAWTADATYAVTDTDFLAVDVRLEDLDSEPAEIELTVPAGGSLRVVRNPGAWSDAGVEILGAGGWAVGPVVLGNWSLTVSAGGLPTDPAVISVSNPDGTAATGLLRLVFRGLAGGALSIGPGGGTLSIDRLLADPSILNPQVASPPLPVHELDAVSLTAAAQATAETNPVPAAPLAALPTVLAIWNPEPGNPAALPDFASVGTSASFTAPAVYDTLSLDFRLTAAYDLDADLAIDPDDPAAEEVLSLDVETVTHGMLLVLDRSGSMGSSLGGGISKWEGTVRAAHAWLDLFRSFRTGDQHQAGILTFEHDGCSWGVQGAAADVTLRSPTNGAAAAAMSSLASLGADLTTFDLGTDQTCTPIGDALVEGWKKLGAALAPGARASAVLLTDGYENCGRVTIAAAKGSASATFATERVTPQLSFANDLVADRLYTIAVGASVDEDRLDDLGTGFYQMTQKVTDILPAFAEMLGDVLDAHPVLPVGAPSDPDSPPHPIYYDISTGEQRVALLVPWTSATHNLRIGWRLQSNPAGAFTIVAGADPAVIAYHRRQFHGLMAIDLKVLTGSDTPPATTFRIQHLDAGNVAQPLTDADVLSMVDLVTKAEITFDRERYFTGDAIGLGCRIRSGGLPVLGARVGVDAAAPGEGLGTFLATQSPVYKKIARDTRPRGADPDQGKGLMFKTLLVHNQIDALPLVTPPDFELTDPDGDGDYTAAFLPTDKEGTYTFRFRITGTLADGSRFSRVFVRSVWVGVKPDPAATLHVLTAIDIAGGASGWLLTLTPKSASGEFLGPFRGDVVGLTVSGGTLDGPLVDNLDGSYSQRIVAATGKEPVVGIEVYGVPLTPVVPGLEAPSCLKLWWRALLCTLRKIWRAIFG